MQTPNSVAQAAVTHVWQAADMGSGPHSVAQEPSGGLAAVVAHVNTAL
jgi:hypothetical protein